MGMAATTTDTTIIPGAALDDTKIVTMDIRAKTSPTIPIAAMMAEETIIAVERTITIADRARTIIAMGMTVTMDATIIMEAMEMATKIMLAREANTTIIAPEGTEIVAVAEDTSITSKKSVDALAHALVRAPLTGAGARVSPLSAGVGAAAE
jgi:hypothetical protein